MSKILSKLKDKKGQNVVEFALVLLLFLLLTYGITEFGRAWYRADLLKNAANIAARTYAVTPDPDKARSAARTVISTLTDAQIVIDTTTPGQVKVTVTEQFRTMVPGISELGGIFGGTGGITLSRYATYRLET